MDNTKNFLSPLNFKFKLKRAPNLNFFIQKIDVPGLALPNVDSPNPFLTYPVPGDHLSYDDLIITFKVDENLENYMEIQNWIRGLGRPFPDQYKILESNPVTTGESLRSDISVTILTSSKQPNYELVFIDAYPVRLSGFEFDTTADDVNYIQASVTFKYQIYDINKIF